MPSLILEGGTFRPIFSAGVMDALLDNNIMFPYYKWGIIYIKTKEKKSRYTYDI